MLLLLPARGAVTVKVSSCKCITMLLLLLLWPANSRLGLLGA
jgi:LSD1 subclass zinc finger protein